MGDIEVETAGPEHRGSILELLAASLGRDESDSRFSDLFDWKHHANPFGRSAQWVALADRRVVGYRAFMRWEFEGDGRRWSAVRAVDTATAPEFQGQGIFRRLTMHGLDSLAAEGVNFVFNTPNDQSRPGYLKMGWQVVGKQQPWVRPESMRALRTMARSRAPAAYWGEHTDVGAPPDRALSDQAALGALFASAPPGHGAALSTTRSADYLRWRYGLEALKYRVLLAGASAADGMCCFRVRRRGEALETVIGDVIVPGNSARSRRRLIRRVVDETGAAYGLLLGASLRDGAVPLFGQGPVLVRRPVRMGAALPNKLFSLSMGDIELF